MRDKTFELRVYFRTVTAGTPISLKNVSRLAQALGLSASKLVALAERRVKQGDESE
ncbi:MAG TPA: hypothetical protein V6C97_24155 [Oculatellaceae cyanobacterium]